MMRKGKAKPEGKGKKKQGISQSGLCVLCGARTDGTPANQDVPILAARKIRKLLGIPPVRSVACEKCLPECKALRASFEKSRRNYLVAAAVFFFGIAVFGLYLGALGLGLAFSIVTGALLIILIPYGRYIPRFS